MLIYAQLNNDNVVEGISYLSGEVAADNLILINDLEVRIGSTYDSVTQTFTPPSPQPTEPQTTVKEMQAQTLLNTELLLIYKELETGV